MGPRHLTAEAYPPSAYSPREREPGAEGAAGVSSPSVEAGEAQVSGLDEVVARMKELASNRGDALRRSKRDRSTLKSTFRDLLGVVEVRFFDLKIF